MLRVAAVAAMLLSCGGGPSDVACTTCPGVAGNYAETFSTGSVTCENGDTLSFVGGSDEVNLQQSGANLALSKGEGTVDGTLHTDLSVTFQPLASTAQSEQGGASDPGELFIVGQFSSTTPPSFGATYTFVRTSDQCRVSVTAEWSFQQ